jgi:hypothetical protein
MSELHGKCGVFALPVLALLFGQPSRVGIGHAPAADSGCG